MPRAGEHRTTASCGAEIVDGALCQINTEHSSPQLSPFESLNRCIYSINPSIPILLCGDFNTVLDRVVDGRGSCPLI